ESPNTGEPCEPHSPDQVRFWTIAATVKLIVSPAEVVLDVVNAPWESRTFVTAESHSSTAAVVAAGMFVKLMVEAFDADPDAGVPAPRFCRAYDPPVTSVPFAVADPCVVINATWIGAVGAVYVPTCNMVLSRFVANA